MTRPTVLGHDIDRLDSFEMTATAIAVALGTTARTVQRRRAARRIEQQLAAYARPEPVRDRIAAADTGDRTVVEVARIVGCSRRAVYDYRQTLDATP